VCVEETIEDVEGGDVGGMSDFVSRFSLQGQVPDTW
jgi:hypothetical protein